MGQTQRRTPVSRMQHCLRQLFACLVPQPHAQATAGALQLPARIHVRCPGEPLVSSLTASSQLAQRGVGERLSRGVAHKCVQLL